MRTFFKVVYIVATLFLIVSCGSERSSDGQMEFSHGGELKEHLFTTKTAATCFKAETEQKLTSQARANEMTIEDEIETQTFEYLDCKGEVMRQEKRPISAIQEFISLPVPEGLDDKVRFVEVVNDRTCAKVVIAAKEDQYLIDEVDLEQSQVINMPGHTTQVGQSGKVTLFVTDSLLKMPDRVNVIDGSNVLFVRYFGACTKYKTSNDASGIPTAECEKADLLAKQEVIIQLQVNRPELSEVKRVHQCRLERESI